MSFLEGILWLALNIYHEGRSESPKAQTAIAHVTLNRTVKRNLNLRDVVLQPHQFSWTDQKSDWWPTDWPAYFECLESALVAFATKDLTRGATYYHRQDIHPYWAESFVRTGKFGVHIFYKEIE